MDFESASPPEPPASSLEPPVPPERTSPTFAERAAALLEVIICSGFPTQILLAATFAVFGFLPYDASGALTINYVVVLSLTDTVFLIGLIVAFLIARGERPREVFLGGRPIWREARAGLPLTLVAFAIAVIVMVGVQQIAPWMHTVEHNPLQDLIRAPGDAAIFAFVVVIAGGVREEVQRAFLLRRFERWLGGPRVGIVVGSAIFGAGHLMQGADAAIATALLGAFWAIVYLRRESVVAPVVSHWGFNLLQLVQFLVVGH